MTDRWLRLFVQYQGHDASQTSDVLIELGGSAVQEVDGGLVTFIAEREVVDPAQFAGSVKERLEEAVGECAVRWSWQDAEDWSKEWRRGLRPRRFGRVVVTPSWTEPDVEPDDIVLVI